MDQPGEGGEKARFVNPYIDEAIADKSKKNLLSLVGDAKTWNDIFWLFSAAFPRRVPSDTNVVTEIKHVVGEFVEAARNWPGKKGFSSEKIRPMKAYRRGVEKKVWARIPTREIWALAEDESPGAIRKLGEMDDEYKNRFFNRNREINGRISRKVFEETLNAGESKIKEIFGMGSQELRVKAIEINGEKERYEAKDNLRKIKSAIEGKRGEAEKIAISRYGYITPPKRVVEDILQNELVSFELRQEKRKAIDQLKRVNRRLEDRGGNHYAGSTYATQEMIAFHLDFIEKMKSASPVSSEAAKLWAEKSKVTDAAKKEMLRQEDKIGSECSEDSVRKNMAELYQISGGGVPVVSLDYDEKRAYAFNWSINIGANIDKLVLWHEMGHVLENQNPAVQEATSHFLKVRAKNDRLSTIHGLKGERGYRDEFFDHYVGKFYGKGQTTEIVSMGIQMLANPTFFARLIQKDPEHFTLIMGALSLSKHADRLNPLSR